MKLSFAIPALAATLLAVTASSAFAFEAVNNDQFPASTFSTKLADPDDIAGDMAVQDSAQHYFGQNATIRHFGNLTVGIAQSNGFGPPGMTMIQRR